MSLITTIIDGLAPNPSTGLGGANEGYIQGFQDDILTGVAGGVANKADGQCLVTENDPNGMSVLVADGVVYVPNADYIAGLASTTKFYRVVIKDEDPLTIASNGGATWRLDGIDVVIDKEVVPNEYGSNVATLVVTQGTGEDEPAVPDNGYRLAVVQVDAGETQIVDADIQDARTQISIDMDVLSTNIVTKTDTQTLLDGTKVYAADAGSTDDYAITLAPAPTAYAAGQTFRFKANTANTGAATLNVNSLGAKTIKKNYNSDLATGDILANQLVEVIYDGTNFQMLSPVAGSTATVGADGWTPAGETFTYATATTVTIPTDLTTKYYKGMKIKLTQTTGGTKFFIIATDPSYGSPNTTLTLHPYDGSTTIANEAITSPYYSSADKPAGFPSKPKLSAYLSSAQDNIADNTTTLVNIDAENYDIGANFNTTTHLFTAPVTGYYDVKGGVGWKNGTTVDQKPFSAELFVDSTSNATVWIQSSGIGALIIPVARTLYVAKGSTISLRCYHNVGGATPDIYNNNKYTFLTVEFIEP